MTDSPPKYKIRGIPAPLVDHFWKQCEPFIKRALDHAHGEFLPSDVRSLVKSGAAQLWLVTKGDKIVAACTTEIIVYPRKKHCRIFTLAGSNAEEWAPLANFIIEQWAIEQGCTRMEAITRKGLIPKLQNIGYSFKQAILIKEFPNESEFTSSEIPPDVSYEPEDQSS